MRTSRPAAAVCFCNSAMSSGSLRSFGIFVSDYSTDTEPPLRRLRIDAGQGGRVVCSVRNRWSGSLGTEAIEVHCPGNWLIYGVARCSASRCRASLPRCFADAALAAPPERPAPGEVIDEVARYHRSRPTTRQPRAQGQCRGARPPHRRGAGGADRAALPRCARRRDRRRRAGRRDRHRRRSPAAAAADDRHQGDAGLQEHAGSCARQDRHPGARSAALRAIAPSAIRTRTGSTPSPSRPARAWAAATSA